MANEVIGDIITRSHIARYYVAYLIIFSNLLQNSVCNLLSLAKMFDSTFLIKLIFLLVYG